MNACWLGFCPCHIQKEGVDGLAVTFGGVFVAKGGTPNKELAQVWWKGRVIAGRPVTLWDAMQQRALRAVVERRLHDRPLSDIIRKLLGGYTAARLEQPPLFTLAALAADVKQRAQQVVEVKGQHEA